MSRRMEGGVVTDVQAEGAVLQESIRHDYSTSSELAGASAS